MLILTSNNDHFWFWGPQSAIFVYLFRQVYLGHCFLGFRTLKKKEWLQRCAGKTTWIDLIITAILIISDPAWLEENAGFCYTEIHEDLDSKRDLFLTSALSRPPKCRFETCFQNIGDTILAIMGWSLIDNFYESGSTADQSLATNVGPVWAGQIVTWAMLSLNPPTFGTKVASWYPHDILLIQIWRSSTLTI